MQDYDPFLGYLLSLINRPLFPPIFKTFSGNTPDSQINSAWLEEYLPLNTSEPDKSQISNNVLRPNRENRLLTTIDLFNTKSCLLLCGENGCGKRTFLRTALIYQTCQNLNKRNLGNVPQGNVFSPGEFAGNWQRTTLLPIYFSINDFKSWSSHQLKGRSLIFFLMNQLSKKSSNRGISSLQNEIASRGVQLFVDAASINDMNIQQYLFELNQLARFFQENPKCQILVVSSCEKNTWLENGLSREFFIADIQNLNQDSVQNCLRSLFNFFRKVNKKKQSDFRSNEINLSEQLLDNKKLLEISKNPFYLTILMILSIFADIKNLTSEEEIIDAAIRLIIDHWTIEGRKLEDILMISDEEIIIALGKLAFQYTHTIWEKQPETSLNRKIIASELLGIVQNPALDKHDFMEQINLQGGIFQGTETDTLNFSYEPITDYLKASYLSKIDSIKEVLDKIMKNPESNQNLFKSIVFNIEQANQQKITKMIELLTGVKGTNSSWASFFAGMVFKMYPQIKEKNPHLLAGAQSALIQNLESGNMPIRKLPALGEMIDQLGDLRFSSDFWFLPTDPMLGFVEIPEGNFFMGTRENQIQNLINEFGIGSDWEGQTLGSMLSQEPNVDQLIKELGLSEGWENLDTKLLMRQWYKREIPLHPVWLPTYFIARYPVTIAQFRTFILSSGSKPEIPEGLEGISNHPISHVTWSDAIKYCQWLTVALSNSKHVHAKIKDLLLNNWRICLPSEAEWEKAARGPSEGDLSTRKYPWGNEFSAGRANLKETGIGMTTSVGAFPKGASYYGLFDMAGNVWEWTRSMWGAEEYLINFPYPYDPNDGRESKQMDATNSLRTLRGASFNNYRRYARCSTRRSPLPVLRTSIRGFRIVLTSYQTDLL